MKWRLQRLRRLFQARIGVKTRIWPDASLRAEGGSIRIGTRCHVHSGVMLLAEGGTLQIGDECSFNPYVVVYGRHGVHIGNQVRIATHTVIGPETLEPAASTTSTKAITIEDDVWLGCNVVVLQGVRIGRGSVVGAGSVVARDLPPYSVAVGIPARPVKSRKDSSS